MPATKTAKSKFEPIAEAPKPWKRVKPNGLHVFPQGITKPTRDKLWAFFHPINGAPEGNDRIGTPPEGGFPWFQRFKRFPKTAHFNGFHSGKFTGENGPAEFEAEQPLLYQAAIEALETARSTGQDMGDVPAFGDFRPESISIMRHKPGWGLGFHYDNAHDEGTGMVMMLTISDDDTVPRTFEFNDPPHGLEYKIETPDSQVTIFGGEAYDFWRHGSVHNKKQTAEVISLTIRLAGVCGYDAKTGGAKAKNGGVYATGAPAAQKVAHERIRAKWAAEEIKREVAASVDAVVNSVIAVSV